MFPFDLSQTRYFIVLFFSLTHCIPFVFSGCRFHNIVPPFSQSTEPDLAQVLVTVHLSGTIFFWLHCNQSVWSARHSFPLSALLVFIIALFLTYCLFFCPQSSSQLGTAQLKIASMPLGAVVKYVSKIKQTAQTTQEQSPLVLQTHVPRAIHETPHQGRRCLPGTPHRTGQTLPASLPRLEAV